MVVPMKSAIMSPGPVLVSSLFSPEAEEEAELFEEPVLFELEEFELDPVLLSDGDCSEPELLLPEFFEEPELPDVLPEL
jgi:hypothetical protein